MSVIVAVAYLLSVIIGAPAVGPEFAPDSPGYLEFSPYRQPLYGMWANGSFSVLGTWEKVKVAQIAIFALSGAWLVFELAMISSIGFVAAFASIGVHVVLIRLGLLSIVASLVSEGLFYSMILLFVAMLLAWLRLRRTGLLVGVLVLLVTMGQVRSAALLVPVAALFGAVAIALLFPHSAHRRRHAILAVTVLLLASFFIPVLSGKSAFQLGTSGDRIGFVILPRVSLLPVPGWIAERVPEWVVMTSSWRTAATNLNAVALTQFDAQLQEVIRYELGPKVLLPAVLERPRSEVEDGWLRGGFDAEARQLAVKWIATEWPTYLRLSAIHFWGMLTAGNLMNNASREEVWRALHSVSAQTWSEGGLRTDYPLNQVNKKLKPATSVVYVLLRYTSIGLLILGVTSAILLIRDLAGDRDVGAGGIAIVATVAWAAAHSMSAALCVFPEFRYTYANMLAVFSGGAAWCAYLGVETVRGHIPREDEVLVVRRACGGRKNESAT